MARLPRLNIANIPQLQIQRVKPMKRGNDRKPNAFKTMCTPMIVD